jgi:hypothetical protein
LTKATPYGNILLGKRYYGGVKWKEEMKESGELVTDEFEQKLRELIDEVLELRKLWEQRRSEAEERIKTLDAKLAAYQTTLKNHWESINGREQRE